MKFPSSPMFMRMKPSHLPVNQTVRANDWLVRTYHSFDFR